MPYGNHRFEMEGRYEWITVRELQLPVFSGKRSKAISLSKYIARESLTEASTSGNWTDKKRNLAMEKIPKNLRSEENIEND